MFLIVNRNGSFAKLPVAQASEKFIEDTPLAARRVEFKKCSIITSNATLIIFFEFPGRPHFSTKNDTCACSPLAVVSMSYRRIFAEACFTFSPDKGVDYLNILEYLRHV